MELLDIDQLPTTTEKVYGFEPFGSEGPVRTVLCGTREKESPLRVVRDHEAIIVREIQSYFTSKFVNHIKLTLSSQLFGRKTMMFSLERNRSMKKMKG